MSDEEEYPLTPENLLNAYAQGYFPMAADRHGDDVYWFSPTKRGILPLADFNVPRGLKRVLGKHGFELRVNSAFREVIRACAELNAGRTETWINDRIIDAYGELHRLGHAHSVETWQDGQLVGGLYGVSLGGAFFGESMFSRVSEASKVALVTLVDVLKEAGYALLDTQYVNPHLKQFGVEEWPKKRYLAALQKALNVSPNPSKCFCTVSLHKGLATSSSSSRKS